MDLGIPLMRCRRQSPLEQTEQPQDGAEIRVQREAHSGREPRPEVDAREPRPLR